MEQKNIDWEKFPSPINKKSDLINKILFWLLCGTAIITLFLVFFDDSSKALQILTYVFMVLVVALFVMNIVYTLMINSKFKKYVADCLHAMLNDEDALFDEDLESSKYTLAQDKSGKNLSIIFNGNLDCMYTINCERFENCSTYHVVLQKAIIEYYADRYLNKFLGDDESEMPNGKKYKDIVFYYDLITKPKKQNFLQRLFLENNVPNLQPQYVVKGGEFNTKYLK